MSKITSILAFLLIFLIFFSLSLPSSAQDQPAATLVPNSKVQVHEDGRFLSSAQPRKLKIFMKKGVRGGRGFGTGVATRARGRTSSAYRTSQISSFHFGSVFACSLFLGFLVL
ncbi:hypothetical protein Pint_14369 [Pistacia integerrima]|uniref:Uncharacterized protein n=1 Tax=Pistacia integerrima TaxID=434235 RepID=A0ACC0Y4P9_9ROSI|nr:hypothetical protein Pint_14369 [Pistacia integerrima]